MVSGLGPNEQSLIDLVRARAEHELGIFVDELRATGAQIRNARSEPGDAARTIVQVAEKEHYDLVVVGTHGRSGLSRLLVGSVAERVVRHSARPVLTVRG
jgi:nucleotide-binding universal stress UspA family protein